MVVFHSYVSLPEGIQIWIFQGKNFSWCPTFHPSCFPFCTTWIKILYREAWIMDPPKKCHGFFIFSPSYHNTKHHFILISADLTTQKLNPPNSSQRGVFQILSGWWFQPTPLKNDGVKVSWDDGNSQLNGKIKFMFQTTNTNYLISKTTNWL